MNISAITVIRLIILVLLGISVFFSIQFIIYIHWAILYDKNIYWMFLSLLVSFILLRCSIETIILTIIWYISDSKYYKNIMAYKIATERKKITFSHLMKMSNIWPWLRTTIEKELQSRFKKYQIIDLALSETKRKSYIKENLYVFIVCVFLLMIYILLLKNWYLTSIT